MASEIEISTRRYERIFGRKPRGFGLWHFQLPGGRVFTYSGHYSAACRIATEHARHVRSTTPILIQVSA